MKRSGIIIALILGISAIVAVWLGGKYFNKARGHAKTVS